MQKTLDERERVPSVPLSPTSWEGTHQSSWNWKEQKRDCAFGSLEEICACVNNRLGELFLGGRFWDQLRHLVSKEAS